MDILYKKELMKVIFDKDDLQIVITHGPWHVIKHNNNYYASNSDTRLMHTFIIPNERIRDHINRYGLNNRKSNIKITTQAGNARNNRIPSNNTSGYKGVGLKGHIWYASWKADGKRHYKYFNSNQYGNDEAKELAIAYRKEMEIKYDYLP